METEYIEKQAALDNVNGWRDQLIPTYGENDEYVKCLETVAEHLESLHAADVRPVVYCKDCDEAKRDTVDGAIYCSVWDYWEMPEKGFCHYGSSIMKDGD